MEIIEVFETTNINADIDIIDKFAHRDYKSKFSSESYFGVQILEYWSQDFVEICEDIIHCYSADIDYVDNFFLFQLRILQLSQEDDYRINEFRSFLQELRPKPICARLFIDELRQHYSMIKQVDNTIIDIDPKDCVMLIEEWNDIFCVCKTVNGYFGSNGFTSA